MRAVLCTLFLTLPVFGQQAPPAVPPTPTLANTVRPFLETHCQSCHNGKLRSGDINFEVLKYANNLAPQKGVWETTAYVMKTGRMPPPASPRPPQAEADAARAIIESGLAKIDQRAAEAAKPPTPEWLTWQADPERTGWARGESALTKATAPKLGLLWKAQLDAVPTRVNGYSTLTDPLVAENVRTSQGVKTVVFTASAENNVYAMDAASGAVLWQRRFPNTAKAPTPSGNCPNNLNATPVIDKPNSILYALTNEGKLRALGLGDGEDRMTPVEFTEPYSRNWSLNLIDGWIYTSTSRGCAAATSVITGVDVSKPSHPVARFYPSTGKASGPWGRGGIVRLPTGVIAQTADGAYDPASGRFGNTMLGLTKDLRLTDSYTPANWDYLNRKDFDLGVSSPTVFGFDKWTLVAAAAKEGVIYLLDAASLGGGDHMTPLYVSPRYGNDALTFGYNGVWGSLSTWVDAKGERWLLAPMMGPPAKDTEAGFKNPGGGKVVNGSVMAFRVKKRENKPVLEPVWMSGDLDSPGMPVMANGVVYVLATGDRARDAFRPGFLTQQQQPAGPGGAPPPPRRRLGLGGPENQVNPNEPGAERDAAWLTSQNEPGGQTPGRRFSGGRDVTHAVLYALDAETGQELYSSGELLDSWNHYGGLALAGGRLYVSTYDARVYAFGLAAPAAPQPMNIGITCYPTYGGSGIVATELGMELAARGHDVHFISYAHPIRLDTGLERVHYHEVEVANYPLFAYPPYCLALASRMAEVALEYELDLLHVHYAIPHSISAHLARQMLARRGRKLPFVTTLHGTDITLVGVEPSYFEITKFSIEESDGITAVSQYLIDRTREVFGVASPMRAIHNFVNCDLYRPAPAPPGCRPRLIHLSNFRPVKRPADCVRVLAKVAAELDAELWMVGDGPERGPVERLAHELGVKPRVRFLGKQDHVERLLPQAGALLLPSEHEAFGLAALEAMACGVVPVATRTGGVGELVTHGEDGYLEAVGDVDAMAARVRELFTNPTRRAGMAAAARHTAQTRFSTELIIPQYEDYYRSVLSGGSGALNGA